MITIITITKDDVNGLAHTLKSTRILRSNNFFCQIVIDSSNETNKVAVNKIVSDEQNVSYHWIEPKGVSNAFNFGLSKVETEWIWYLNGGDTYNTQIQPYLLQDILKTTKAQGISFSCYITDSNNNETILGHPELNNLWPPVYNYLAHPSMILRTQILKEVNGFREDFNVAMDGELWFRLFSKPNIVVDLISIPIARFYNNGLSSNLKKHARDVLKIFWIHKYLLMSYGIKVIKKIILAFFHFFKLSRH
jgi:hypothetical protein